MDLSKHLMPNFNRLVSNIEGIDLRTENKFSKLVNRKKITKLKKKSEPKFQHKEKAQSKKFNKNRNTENLWNELTSISSKDYIGHDLCYKCCKEMNPKVNAGTCSMCNRKAHLKCQKISAKIFKENKDPQKYKRICHLCSKDDEIPGNKIEITKLKVNERPELIENIKGGKK